MLGMLQGNDPFLVYPQRAAATCPGSHCLPLPEDAPPLPLRMERAILDSARFFAPPQKGLPRQASRPTSLDSSRLRLSGSKSVTSSVSSEGVLLQQEMTLDAAGEPTPGLFVKAHLSDKDAPLGSSGSTSSLRQTDEIWIDAHTRRFHGRLGDISLSHPEGLLGNDTRSARGISVELGDSSLRTWGSLAGSRSQWIRREFAGITGIQEGYALTEGYASRALVPGTEKIWLDGILLRRGSDYELRHADGVIDFSPSRRILSSSQITVEAQAADRDYEGSITSGGIAGSTPKIGWEAWAFRVADDATAPLSYLADSTTQSRLALAGSDTTLLRLNDASHIPIPTSQLRVGGALRWQLASPGSLEVRLTSTDANQASARDTIRTAGALAGKTSLREGTPLSKGGGGIWSLNSSFQVWQAAYSPLRPATPDTSLSSWLPPSNLRTSHDQERMDLGWEAQPSLGIRLQARHFHLQDWADLKSAGAKVGFERDSSHVLVLSRSLAQLDQGRKFRHEDTRLRGAWNHRGLTPSLQANFGELTESRSPELTTRKTWLGATTGLSWQRQSGSLALTVHARSDGNDFGTGSPLDSSLALQTRVEGQLQTQQWTASLLLDRLDARTRPDLRSSLMPTTHWLAESRNTWIPIPTGFKLEGQYRLSTSQWRPSLAIYDTVSRGTGQFRFDSTSNEIVADEFGNLILAGSRLDSLHPARQSGNVLLILGANVIPKEIDPSLGGLLADLSTRLQMELEQIDSSQNRLVPDFKDQDLATSILGRSRLEGQIWWSHKPWKGQVRSERNYKNSIQNWSYTRDQETIKAMSASLSKDFFEEILSIGSEVGNSTRVHKWSLNSDFYEKTWLEPSIVLHWGRFEAEASLFLQDASQSHEEEPAVAVNTFSQSLSLSLQTNHSLRLSSRLQHFQIKCSEAPASWLTDNYPNGSSWRTQTGLDWNVKESLQASASWILRITPARPPDQRLDLQAKALF